MRVHGSRCTKRKSHLTARSYNFATAICSLSLINTNFRHLQHRQQPGPAFCYCHQPQQRAWRASCARCKLLPRAAAIQCEGQRNHSRLCTDRLLQAIYRKGSGRRVNLLRLVEEPRERRHLRRGHLPGRIAERVHGRHWKVPQYRERENQGSARYPGPKTCKSQKMQSTALAGGNAQRATLHATNNHITRSFITQARSPTRNSQRRAQKSLPYSRKATPATAHAV